MGPLVLDSNPELLAKYASRVRDRAWLLPGSEETAQDLDELAAAIIDSLINALQAAGCPRKGSEEGAKWWNKGCAQGLKGYRQLRRGAATTGALKEAQKH
jgi:hypothetical protein